MNLSKLQKEYEESIKKIFEQANIICNLYNTINDDINLKNRKGMSENLKILRNILLNFEDIQFEVNNNRIDFINTFDFCEKVKENSNNLLVLPLFPDEDVYVDANVNIEDIFKRKDD